MRVASFKGHWQAGRGLAVIAFNSFSKYGAPIALIVDCFTAVDKTKLNALCVLSGKYGR